MIIWHFNGSGLPIWANLHDFKYYSATRGNILDCELFPFCTRGRELERRNVTEDKSLRQRYLATRPLNTGLGSGGEMVQMLTAAKN